MGWIPILSRKNRVAAALGDPAISGFQEGSEIICKVLKINKKGVLIIW
jgi:hypothetical protein